MCGMAVRLMGLITGDRDEVATDSRVRQDTVLWFFAGSLGIGFVGHRRVRECRKVGVSKEVGEIREI